MTKRMLLAAAAIAAFTGQARAQDGDPGTARLGLRLGYDVLLDRSATFEDDGFAWGLELSALLGARWDLGLGVDFKYAEEDLVTIGLGTPDPGMEVELTTLTVNARFWLVPIAASRTPKPFVGVHTGFAQGRYADGVPVGVDAGIRIPIAERVDLTGQTFVETIFFDLDFPSGVDKRPIRLGLRVGSAISLN